MCKLNVVLFLLMFGQSFAQTSIYVRPSILFKGQFSSNSPTQFGTSPYNQENSFSYKNKNIVLPKKFSPLLLGFSVGVKLKDRFLFEFSANQDESTSGAEIQFLNYDPVYNNYSESQVSYYKGRSFGRYCLQSSVRLAKKKNNTFFIDFGAGLAHRSGGLTIEKTQFDQYSILLDDNYSSMDITSYVVRNNTKSLLLSLGFTDDISFHNKYLFSLSLFYSKSFSFLSTVVSDITVHKGGINKTYTYHSYSRGSGIYIQISRRLQVFPWKLKKRS
jgi:hypothetical protein